MVRTADSSLIREVSLMQSVLYREVPLYWQAYCPINTVHNSSDTTILIQYRPSECSAHFSLSWYFQVVSPALHQSLDDLQIITKHTTVVMVTVVHQEF